MGDSVAIQLLRSIDASLKQMLRQSAPAATVADDGDLDSKHGDPLLRFLPRDWSGEDYKNHHFSQCPPALLDMVAETLDYFARKAEEADERWNDKPTAPYKRKDAARARGWAKRLRAGHRPDAHAPRQQQAPSSGMSMDNEWPSDDEDFR